MLLRSLNREALGFDLNPTRKDIKQADARKIPIEKATADFVFIDPPYSTHITYSGKENCIGELEATSGEYYTALEQVIREIHRILKPRRYMALLVSDSAKKRETVSSDRVQSVQHSERLFPAGGYYCRNTPQCKTSQESLAQRSS
ncbi:class I SAM-dependent methyltransferase [Candidatus Kuenenia stuttgartiensis]|uniref:class I SAM-dependent methyltransferase n=1 Tax=Kuenenia stuttgartiensis TaxID=174633 RepID=UPI001B8BF5A9|nr:class I SAM-dependent methyltransferase [Candidatus Kuenenia stuttgartiensis]